MKKLSRSKLLPKKINRGEDEERYQLQADLEKFRLNFSRSLSGVAGCSVRDHAPLKNLQKMGIQNKKNNNNNTLRTRRACCSCERQSPSLLFHDTCCHCNILPLKLQHQGAHSSNLSRYIFEELFETICVNIKTF